MNKKSRLRPSINFQSWTYLWPALPPILMGMIGIFALRWCLTPEIFIPAPRWNPADIGGDEAAARLAIATTLLLLTAASMAALAVSLLIQRTRFSPRRRAFHVGFALAIIAAILLADNMDGGTPLAAYLGKDLFRSTIDAYDRPALYGTDAIRPPLHGDSWRWSVLENVIFVSTFLGVTVAAFVAVTIPALAPPDIAFRSVSTGPEGRIALDKAAKQLADQTRHLKYLLFATAAVLFAGLAHLKAWVEWPLVFWTTAALKEDKVMLAGKHSFQALAGALVNYEALYYALVLAAIFVPTAAWLRMTGKALAAADPNVSSGAATEDEWLTKKGIGLTLGEQAQRLFALLSPFLVAPLVDLLKSAANLA